MRMTQPLKTTVAVSAPAGGGALDLVQSAQKKLAAKVWRDADIARIPDLSLARFAYETSATLRSKFSTEEEFVAHWLAQRGGRKDPMQTQGDPAQDTRFKAEWSTSPAIRAEFRDSFPAFSAFKRAELRGCARIVRSSVVTGRQ